MRAKISVLAIFLVRLKHVIIHNFIAIIPIYIIVRALEFAKPTLKLSLLRLF